VARQEPAIRWAAGLREDGSTLLVTDLAGGWIPPHVELPAGVVLLEPAVRRHGVSAVDLLGAVTDTAAYEPPGYIAPPGPDELALTGERARYGHHVDELPYTLANAANGCRELHRQVITAAKHVTRRGQMGAVSPPMPHNPSPRRCAGRGCVSICPPRKPSTWGHGCSMRCGSGM
jgi:hypothetical protein